MPSDNMPIRIPSDSESGEDDSNSDVGSESAMFATTSYFGFGKEHDYMNFEQVWEEEKAQIDSNIDERVNSARPGHQKFSVALSGGGVRAAAFQSGVLWRLAQANKLKDVEYLTAVSGGGYLASAFCSQLLGASELPTEGNERKWYMQIVAKTICRMQHNSGNFVRDCFAKPRLEHKEYEEGAGTLPRWMDLPMLVVILLVTIGLVPLVYGLVVVVPIVLAVELFFGSAMRAAFCLNHSKTSWVELFIKWSPFPALFFVAICSTAFLFVIFVCTKIFPSCRLDSKGCEKFGNRWYPRPTPRAVYLTGYSLKSFCTRWTLCLICLVGLLYLVPSVQNQLYLESERLEACETYIKKMKVLEAKGEMSCQEKHPKPGGVDFGPWWTDEVFNTYSTSSWATSSAGNHSGTRARRNYSTLQAHNDQYIWGEEAYVNLTIGSWDAVTHWFFHERPKSAFGVCLLFLGLSLITAIICIPLVGAGYTLKATAIAGPLLVMAGILSVIQLRIYGPVTHNKKGIFYWSDNFKETWDNWSDVCLLVSVALLPFYDEVRSLLHVYYKRSLYQNFFSKGKDVFIRDLAMNPYCPFLILTGTCSDFQPPGDKDTIAEISFSPLHCGGEETGYVSMPYYRTLGKCTALTGAGCLDAISLTMSDRVSLRFWLEFLNLSWGDFMLFLPGTTAQKFTHSCGKMASFWYRTVIRLPLTILTLVIFTLLFVGWSLRERNCLVLRVSFKVAGLVAIIMLALSFFSHHRILQRLTLVPWIRQLHQSTKFIYKGRHPPPVLYVTDGGVQDCTALVQLLWRQCERILLVLAAADREDDLNVLKAGLEVASGMNLASFFDPQDPRGDIKLLLKEFKDNKSQPYLHIGINYCWDEHVAKQRVGSQPLVGDIYVVKNRLPPEFENQPVEPLLTEADICKEVPMGNNSMDDDFEGITMDQLGPFGCCDCCHTKTNDCGPKFPHGTFTGYLYLTPQWFNSLARLGFNVSSKAVEAITKTVL